MNKSGINMTIDAINVGPDLPIVAPGPKATTFSLLKLYLQQ